ncbi:MAG: zinc ribbon domain-containing protein, partial [Microthrixaceae bacterium]
LLRGLLHCGICGRKMEGTTAHQTIRYRCRVAQTRALPAYLTDHPKSLYVREDDVVAAIDRWLPSLADPEFLAASQEADDGTAERETLLKRRLDEIDKATRNLVTAIENGTDPAAIQPRLAELRAERSQAMDDLATLKRPDQLTSVDISALLDELGGMEDVLADALPTEKSDIYASLGLRLHYRPDQREVVATADLDRVLSRVGGPTRTNSYRPLATRRVGRLPHDFTQAAEPRPARRATAQVDCSTQHL